MKKSGTFILSLIMLITQGNAQEKNLFEKQLFVVGEDTLPCRILTPLNFQANKKYPLVVFLHGVGERGDDNEAQLTWGADLFLDSVNRAKYPAIVVFPQCPNDDKWAEFKKTSQKDSTGYEYTEDAPMKNALKLVADFIDTLRSSPQVDKRRVYVGGLSMGGFGTYELLWRRPEVFAAAFPICGAVNPARIKNFRKDMPIWLFHGDEDAVIPVSNSRLVYNTLRSTNLKVRYSEYKDVGHDSWKNAFMEQDLLPWLFAQRIPIKK